VDCALDIRVGFGRQTRQWPSPLLLHDVRTACSQKPLIKQTKALDTRILFVVRIQMVCDSYGGVLSAVRIHNLPVRQTAFEKRNACVLLGCSRDIPAAYSMSEDIAKGAYLWFLRTYMHPAMACVHFMDTYNPSRSKEYRSHCLGIPFSHLPTMEAVSFTRMLVTRDTTQRP